MKAITIFVFITLIMNQALAAQDLQAVDETVKSYSHSFKKPEKLAELINRDFTKPEEKTRAIYAWIALNVEYDVKALKTSTKSISYSYSTPEEKAEIEKKIENDLAAKTLRTRKGVCQGYSTLFKVLCDLSDIECKIITGTAKIMPQDIGKKTMQTNHAWNAVKINETWHLVDVTWGAGHLDTQDGRFAKNYTDVYFFMKPEKFFLKHYPENPDWLLIKKTASDFANLPLYYSLNTNIEIAEPKNGVIKMQKNNTVTIALKNRKNENITFSFNNTVKAKEIVPNIKNGVCYYKVKASAGLFLTIYVNGSAFATYKLDRH
ncbi:transglutaminase domain-containing protein [Geofilum sp. OHC36d9]|uniref:transglutaminase domain-containing protein n=1 Tax=Geofilum sp. OHC36d9 TaxID=3458413 RepID=UPI0040337BCD